MFSNVVETPAVNQTVFVILDQETKIAPVRYSNTGNTNSLVLKFFSDDIFSE